MSNPAIIQSNFLDKKSTLVTETEQSKETEVRISFRELVGNCRL